MRKIFLSVLLFHSFISFSQEIISNINYSNSFRQNQGQNSSYKNADVPSLSVPFTTTFIYLYDTLTLPFVDDFSSNKLKKLKDPRGSSDIDNIDTTNLYYFYKYGICFTSFSAYQFRKNTSWTYTFDTTAKRVDSFAMNPIEVIEYDTPCVTQKSISNFWLPYHTYIFDTATGKPKDSTLVASDTTLFLVLDSVYLDTIYTVKNDPDELWTDNNALVNNTFPKNPITLGVATLDGLDSVGVGYDQRPLAYGQADFLTSKPIDLKTGWQIADSIYFSFFYEAQGYGDYPNLDDSLVVEFKNVNGGWDIVWAKRGPDTIAADTFTRVVFLITDSVNYFYKGFQFRFRNKATISGMNDHWHIDYVFLKNTSVKFLDIAMTGAPSSVLKRYLSMPYNQFKADSLNELPAQTIFNVRNNNLKNTDAYSGTPEFHAFDITSGKILDSCIFAPIGLQPNSDTLFITDTIVHIPAHLPVDSILIKVSYNLDVNTDDNFRSNDSLSFYYSLKNYYAYDDGSAEKTYSLYGAGMKFAYEFKLNAPDTLQAVQINFVHYNSNVSNTPFNLMVWKSISPGSTEETVLYKKNTVPRYVDTVNGIYTYKFTPPLVLDKGTFYVGWEQTYDDMLNLGFDMNNSSRKYAYYTNYQNGSIWTQSKFEGAVMIRPIVGKPLPFKWENILPPAKPEKNEKAIYSIAPNPVSENIELISSTGKFPDMKIEIYNYMGIKMLEKNFENKSIAVDGLSNGFYILRIVEMESGKKSSLKFIKL